MGMMEDYIDDARDEYFNDWLSDFGDCVEEDWWASLPPEDTPLDDDMPDYLADHYDEYIEFAREQFKGWLEDEKARYY